MTAVVPTETANDFAVAYTSDWEPCGGCGKVFFGEKLPDVHNILTGRGHKFSNFQEISAYADTIVGNTGHHGQVCYIQ